MRTPRKTVSTLGLTVLFALSLFGGAAEADRRNPLEGQPPVRRRLEMRKGRLEVAPQLMFSLNQDFRHFIGGSLLVHYHIRDWIGLGLQVGGGGGINSGLTDQITSVLPQQQEGLKPSQSQFNDHLSTINLAASAYLLLTPISGKLALFGAAFLRYDFYALIGFGVLNSSNGYNPAREDDRLCQGGNPNRCPPVNDGIAPALAWGLGAHLYFTPWLGLNLEVRDYVASTNPSGLDTTGDFKVDDQDNAVSNNLFVGVGLSFLLPSARYSR